jgi:hypothetical protein
LHLRRRGIAGTPDPVSAPRALGRSIRIIHIGIWAFVEASMIFLLVAGLLQRSDRRSAFAAIIVGAESAVFIASGWRCPLTTLSESLGEKHGEVTDLFLPPWFASRLPAIHIPLFAITIWLHARNLRG